MGHYMRRHRSTLTNSTPTRTIERKPQWRSPNRNGGPPTRNAVPTRSARSPTRSGSPPPAVQYHPRSCSTPALVNNFHKL